MAHLEKIISKFEAPIRYAMTYGSSTFKQNNNNNPAMTDFIFGVTHSEHWHSLNMRQNAHHYSSLMRMAGSKAISSLQERGAGVYYHPYVNIDGVNIKYGVVGINTLEKDLRDWDTFYLAGRLQKPIKILRDDARIQLANKQNLYNAVRAALFMLPLEFTEEELFLKICGLSYQGDPRMGIAENPHKVYNIVYAQMEEFRKIYHPIIDDMPVINYINESRLQQDDNIKLWYQNFNALPKNLTRRVIEQSMGPGYQGDTFELLLPVLQNENLAKIFEKSIADIVSEAAITQSIKGVLTAGFGKSTFYMYEKIKKRISFS